VSENRVPRRVFEPKREEITGSWKKLHSPVETFIALDTAKHILLG
jgi:hypothetical protein